MYRSDIKVIGGLWLWSLKCALSFGIEWDVRLVKYVVEIQGNNRDTILGEFHWNATRLDMDGKSGNALLFAMDNGQKDVVGYLLQDWISSPVSPKVE